MIYADCAHLDADGVIFFCGKVNCKKCKNRPHLGSVAGAADRGSAIVAWGFSTNLLYSYYQENAAYAQDSAGNQRLLAG
jgi:hypothetical protein